MAPPYSTSFYIGTPATGFPTVYEVPAGYVAVLRDFAARIGAAGVQVAYIAVDEVVVQAVTGNEALAGPDGTIHWTGRLVLPAGSTVQLGYTSAMSCTLSGYLLSG